MDSTTQNHAQPAQTLSWCHCAPLPNLDNGLPHCGLNPCTFCSSVVDLDDEILETHTKLIELLKRRLVMKTQINLHRKPLMDRLPFELISRIFMLCLEEKTRDRLRPWSVQITLSLGGVCRKWRNITLRTPRLWTRVSFTVEYGAPLHHVDVAKAWLNRSGSLPLSLYIYLSGPEFQLNLTHLKAFTEMIDLIRAHSNRWNEVDIWSNHAAHIHKLLNKLQSIPHHLEYISTLHHRCNRDDLPKFYPQPAVLFPRTIYQSLSYINHGVGLWDLPCGFDRLTSIEFSQSCLDELLYFIQNAPNLEKCIAQGVEFHDDDEDNFPLPTSPIIAPKMTFLEITVHQDILRYVTFPSLQIFNNDFVIYWDNDDTFDTINTFLARSSPPLRQCNWTLVICHSQIVTWYEIFPVITSLTVHVERGWGNSHDALSQITEDFLAALARTGADMVLPNLESLTIDTYGLSEASWSLLCQIFEGYPRPCSCSRDQVPWIDDVVHWHTSVGQRTRCDRRLKKIKIILGNKSWERHLSAEKKAFERFEELKDAGIELTAVTQTGEPKFGELI